MPRFVAVPLSTQRSSHKTEELQNVSIKNTYYCDVLTFFDVSVLELLCLETLTFSDVTLSDIKDV